ncbi:MAG: 50S ribosomal protein L27 [Candidatus Omnitrophica bacterium CG12_big_fil_rev_8_21_14_0_65_50_5]|nr:MAG: 50S ribosomal protein L27 [Candidatus Omnitrophica bacterium CG12_big_fil_rev_8_21_14_0_65_50_5]
MAKKGGKTSRFFRETRGLKTSGGQKVTSGSVLTRQGAKWKPGVNVNGEAHLTAACDGEVYFTHKKSSYRRLQTLVNVKAVEQK